jgi:hypothetical protein
MAGARSGGPEGWDRFRPVELPRRSAGPPQASDADPDLRVERPVAAAPQSVGGRFDRGLRRITAERTSLLSWLAESDQAEVLRAEEEIDLRAEPVIDVRPDDATTDAPVEVVSEAAPPAEDLASTSLFQR